MAECAFSRFNVVDIFGYTLKHHRPLMVLSSSTVGGGVRLASRWQLQLCQLSCSLDFTSFLLEAAGHSERQPICPCVAKSFTTRHLLLRHLAVKVVTFSGPASILNISLTPLVDVRSARISCTSQRNPALGVGDVEAADGVEAEGMDDLDIIGNGPPLQCGVVL